MLDTDTGELVEKTFAHEGDELRKFYAALRSVAEATAASDTDCAMAE